MRRLALLFCLLALPGAVSARAQASPPATQMLVVMPFENASAAPGLEWIGESFPEILGERMASGNLFVVGRGDRLYAFERLGIPTNLRPSRATLLRIAEAMDVDYVVMGSYTFDGRSFTASAQLLDMHRLHLSPEVKESGPLVKLIDIQNALAWDLLRMLNPNLIQSRNEFVAGAPFVRLDAFEAYVRGVLASTPQEKIQQLRRAVRLNPDYSRALLELGKTYSEGKDYESAALWLGRVPRTSPLAYEANFYLGLASYSSGALARAQEAFLFVAASLPLTEVYNDLGVVAARRGQKDARAYFERACQADPNDPDYAFNLGLALARSGDTAGAARQMRAVLALSPDDSEAQGLLDALKGNGAPLHLPPERLKSNYDESSFRQLAMEIQNFNEARLATMDDRSHSRFHVERGLELLRQGFSGEAEKQFREAVMLDPTSAAAHSGLAQALENRSDFAGARAEASASLRLAPSADAYLVLARLDLRENKVEGAAQNVDHALALGPDNPVAQALKRDIAAKLAEKAQPLPNR